MNMRRVTIDLSEELYEGIARQVAAGEYESESDAIHAALLETFVPMHRGDKEQAAHEGWLEDELKAAVKEADENPNAFYPVDELRTYLEEQRTARGSRTHAA